MVDDDAHSDDEVVWDDVAGAWRDTVTNMVWDAHAEEWVDGPDGSPMAAASAGTGGAVGDQQVADHATIDHGPPHDDGFPYDAEPYDDDPYDGASGRVSGRRRTISLIVLLIVLAAMAGLGFAAASTFGLIGDGAPDGRASGEPVVVEIPEGVGASTVADILEREGVIRSAAAFNVSARFDDRSSSIRPGVYELTVGMGSGDILEVLSEAPEAAETYRVTIPEGLAVEQVLERLADAGPWDVDDLRAALDEVGVPDMVPVADLPDGAEPWEGLLFPETYEFVLAATPTDIIQRLLDQTEAVLAEVEPHGGLSVYETLVLASLIEREARLSDEQRTISSVIFNRLEIDQLLQIDATVIYALGEHTDRVLLADLEVDSPWNTYQNQGLPPTPISNAGRGAIAAAADPEDSTFFYYVVVEPETGRHGFSETFEEHQQKINEVRSEG